MSRRGTRTGNDLTGELRAEPVLSGRWSYVHLETSGPTAGSVAGSAAKVLGNLLVVVLLLAALPKLAQLVPAILTPLLRALTELNPSGGPTEPAKPLPLTPALVTVTVALIAGLPFVLMSKLSRSAWSTANSASQASQLRTWKVPTELADLAVTVDKSLRHAGAKTRGRAEVTDALVALRTRLFSLLSEADKNYSDTVTATLRPQFEIVEADAERIVAALSELDDQRAALAEAERDSAQLLELRDTADVVIQAAKVDAAVRAIAQETDTIRGTVAGFAELDAALTAVRARNFQTE
jgi:hypothetical protein